MKQKFKTRHSHIDLMECIAIFLVVLYHSTLYSPDIIEEPSTITYLNYLFFALLSPGVPLFFFANGYLLFNKKLDLKKHIYKMIHFIVLCGIWGLGKVLILMPIKNEFLSPVEIVKAVWNWKQEWINSLWFLGALVCLYVLFPVLKTAYDNNKKVFYYFVIVCSLLTFGNTLLNEGATVFLTVFLKKERTVEYFNFFNMFNPFRGFYGYAFVYFCIGGCFYNWRNLLLKIKPLKRNLVSIVVMFLSGLGLWGIGICYSKGSGAMWDTVFQGYDTIFTFINVICIFILCLNLHKDIPLIRLISCNTLGIYFIHEIFIRLTYDSLEKYSFLCNIPFNIVYAIALLAICLFITLIMKKIPGIRKLVS